MNVNSLRKYIASTVFLTTLFTCLSQSSAQITTDGSTKTTLTSTENGIRIDNGDRAGSNLFHSFREFGVLEGQGAYFSNPQDITNIFSRVTGNSISEILGTLGVDGNANLFFINPNGIIFGKNSSLDISGDFLATTAEKIIFSDNTTFDTKIPNSPLLTISVPVGLEIGKNPGSITVLGSGHNLVLNTSNQTFRLPSFSSLTVNSGQKLALIGGDIFIDGGVLLAEDGHIELGSVAEGKVFFDSTNTGNFHYNVSRLQNINFTNLALADTSGLLGGSMRVTGNQISFQSGSGLFVQNIGRGNENNIKIDAKSINILGGALEPAFISEGGFVTLTEDLQTVKIGLVNNQLILPNTPLDTALQMLGLSINEVEPLITFVPSFIFSESLQDGQGVNISIKTKKLFVENGSQLITRSFNSASAGNIKIDAATLTEVKSASNTPGFAERGFEIFSQINSTTFSSGRGGNINLATNKLSTSNGGSVSSSTISSGRGGNVKIDANNIELRGTTPGVFTAASISAITANDGDAGNVTIDASSILLADGASIGTSTFADGNAGKLRINAIESIEITGIEPGTGIPSNISSDGFILPPTLREAFRLPSQVTGAAGEIEISTERLELSDRGEIGVQNVGTGIGGKLTINANSIFLDNQSNINASTTSADGGNLFVNADRIELNNSNITASAGGQGNGGNITVNSDIFTVLNNSGITANADEGNGGNINITANGLFVSPDGTITASSKLGIDGTINIQTLSSDLEKDLVRSDPYIIDVEQEIAKTCLSDPKNRSTLTQTSTRGLPLNPESEHTNLKPTRTGVDPIAHNHSGKNKSPENLITSQMESFIPATQLIKTKDGKIHLIASFQEARHLLCDENT